VIFISQLNFIGGNAILLAEPHILLAKNLFYWRKYILFWRNLHFISEL